LPAQRDAVTDAAGGHSAPLARSRAACSDADLLKMHVNGDPEAFGELFLRHRDRLWAVALRTLSDPEDAADALQEAMISAFRRAGSFRGESAVTTWLHRIVVNACLDRMRRRTARPEVPGGDERLLDLLASSEPGADPAASSELSMEVMDALRQLPRDQQVALVLVDMLEYPVADAADLLGVAQGTVKSRCARGRARLLPRLAHLRQTAGSAGVAGRSGVSRGAGVPGVQDTSAGASGAAGNAFAGLSGESEEGSRNRIQPGSVLPAQKGGDDEE
jgi:RNA polymerase sigma-70 factor (ECF subfamily)